MNLTAPASPHHIKTVSLTSARTRSSVLTEYAESINELVALCCSGFSATSNPFYPYFLVILDEQTEQDGSACLVHRIGDETTRTLRVHPHTLSGFMGVASIEHTTIEDIILNNCPEDDPEQANAFVYGDAVPPTVRLTTAGVTLMDTLHNSST